MVKYTLRDFGIHDYKKSKSIILQRIPSRRAIMNLNDGIRSNDLHY